MEPERWQKVKELYNAALGQERGQRASFVKEATSADPALGEEVLSLLACDGEGDSFLEASALEVVAQDLASEKEESRQRNSSRPVLIGQTVSHYRIIEKLGGGGMGVVYKAEDTRLHRSVALKFLPEELERHPQALERLRREARAASALSHPNICTIHDIDEVNGKPFIAMELLEGTSLRHRITESPFKIGQFIEIAIQIADALDAAHAKGIIHRDIKPENIVITQRGQTKVLDFGIAKQLPAQTGQGEAEISSQGDAARLTHSGLVLGTVAYMSPEQARGEHLDARTDLFNLGAVIFEMTTGCQAFPGETAALVFDGILNREPGPASTLNPEVPEKFDEILHKALEKDAKLRYQNASDLRTDLMRLKRDTGSAWHVSGAARLDCIGAPMNDRIKTNRRRSVPVPLDHRTDAALVAGVLKRHPLALLLAAATALLVIAGVGYNYYRLAHRRPLARGTGMKMVQLTNSGTAFRPAISPDGKYVVYFQLDKKHQNGLWLYQVGTGSNVGIVAPVTPGLIPATFSNDGNYVYYVNHEKEHPSGVLCKVASLGGVPQELFDNLASAVSFSPDGKRLTFARRFAEPPEFGLVTANEDGSALKIIRTFGKPENLFNNPTWSPDGKTIAVPVRMDPTDNQTRLVAVSVQNGERKVIGTHAWSGIARPTWLPDGSGLLTLASEIASPDQSQIYEISYPEGEPRRITVDLSSYGGLGVTVDGNSLVTSKREDHLSLWIGSSKAGHAVEEHVLAGYDGSEGVDWTPDGRVVYTASSGTEENLGSMDPDGAARRQLTALSSEGEWTMNPSTCGDGRHIVAESNRKATFGLLRIDADGTNLFQLTSGSYDTSPECSPDGKWVVFSSNSTAGWSLWKVSIDGGVPTQLTTRETDFPAVSPDGKWIACVYSPPNHESGKLAIMPADGGEFTKTFELKGIRVKWTPDGRNLTYSASDGVADNLWNQAIGGGAPRKITDFATGGIFSFAWSRDGNRLAIVRGSRSNDVVMISNFQGGK